MSLKKTLITLAVSCIAAMSSINIYASNPVGQAEFERQLSYVQTTASSWAALCSQGQTIGGGCNIPKSATPEMRVKWKAVLKATGFASHLGQSIDDVIAARDIMALSIPANRVSDLTATYTGEGFGQWTLYTEEAKMIEPLVMIDDTYVTTIPQPLRPEAATKYSSVNVFSSGGPDERWVYALFIGFDSQGKVEANPIGCFIFDRLQMCF